MRDSSALNVMYGLGRCWWMSKVVLAIFIVDGYASTIGKVDN